MKTVKCVVWDLDDTVWEGTLLEGEALRLRPGVLETIEELDRRGVLHSIASRNDMSAAWARLTELGLAEYFVRPHIGWGAKSESVCSIATSLNIALDTLAFVDDQEFEREEVRHRAPEVLCVDAADAGTLLAHERLRPASVSPDARRRRLMYQAEAQRDHAEERFDGTPVEFLATLGLRLRIAPARTEDLDRAVELTERTNQLNATGRTYSREELDALRVAGDHDLLVASLSDRFGDYGTIGLCLVQRGEDGWLLKLLLMSCRVMSRGVGSLLLRHVVEQAHDAGVPLRALFVPTDRNRAMLVTYRFGGFRTEDGAVSEQTLVHDGRRPDPVPGHVKVDVVREAPVVVG